METRQGCGIIAAASLVAVVLLLVPDGVMGQELCTGERTERDSRTDREQIEQLLDRRNFGLLNTLLDELQKGYVAGRTGEETLHDSFAPFRNPRMGTGAKVRDWLTEEPSTHAATAMALHEVALGQLARGKAFRSETTEAQMAGLRRHMGQARRLLDGVLQREPRSPVAHAAALEVARYLDQRNAIDARYAQAVAAVPGSAYVRKSYLLAIDPRWHGSQQEVLDFVDQTLRSDLPEPTRRVVAYFAFMQLGAAAETYDRPDLAVPFYREAGDYCRLADPWSRLANIHNARAQWPEAIGALDRYLRLAPDQAWAIRRKAYALQKLDRWGEAMPLYLRAATLGDDYAQNTYGWYLMQGEHIAVDLPAAIRWFRLAAAQGNTKAKANLATALARQQAGRESPGR